MSIGNAPDPNRLYFPVQFTKIMKPCGLLAGILNNAKYATRQRARTQAKPVHDISRFETFEVANSGKEKERIPQEQTWLAERTTWFTEKQLGLRKNNLVYGICARFSRPTSLSNREAKFSSAQSRLRSGQKTFFLTESKANFLKNRFPRGRSGLLRAGHRLFLLCSPSQGKNRPLPPSDKLNFRRPGFLRVKLGQAEIAAWFFAGATLVHGKHRCRHRKNLLAHQKCRLFQR